VAAWVRLPAPLFIRMFRTWLVAVSSLMNSCAAISRLLAPAPRSRGTSISRLVRPSVRLRMTPLNVMACDHAGYAAQPARLGDGQCLLGQLLCPGHIPAGASQMRRVRGQGFGLVQ
jgi:hypothetical protein